MNFRTQRMITFALLGLTMLVAGLLGLPSRNRVGSVSAQAQTPTPDAQSIQRTVSVTGSGSVRAAPDTAIVVVGVQTDDETASGALTANNTQMQALMSALTGADIAQADIRTQSIQLYPRYSSTPPERPSPTPGAQGQVNQLTGYTALNTVEVRVREMDNLGEILDSAVAAGGNTIQSIYFDVSDPAATLDDAREAAMQDARRKAEQLADLAGADLGGVISIHEASRYPMPYERSAVAMDQAAGGAVPVSPGQQTLVVDIQVTWELQVTGTAQP